jgi:hypothetical protein
MKKIVLLFVIGFCIPLSLQANTASFWLGTPTDSTSTKAYSVASGQDFEISVYCSATSDYDVYSYEILLGYDMTSSSGTERTLNKIVLGGTTAADSLSELNANFPRKLYLAETAGRGSGARSWGLDIQYAASGTNHWTLTAGTVYKLFTIKLTNKMASGDSCTIKIYNAGNGSSRTSYLSGAANGSDAGTKLRKGFTATVTSTPRPGDANGDNKVDVGDLGILAANYGTTADATWAMGDFNGDMKVDVGDLGILAANYGTGTSGTNFASDYAQAFGTTETTEDTDDDADVETVSSACSELGLSLIAVFFMMGIMQMKVKE